jgi:hypothetical protein
MDFTTELRQADEAVNNYVTAVAQHLKQLGFSPDRRQHDVTYCMSLAIAVVAQTFLACGGNIDKGEDVGEMVKQGIITTMKAYKDASRVTHPGSNRRN